MTYWNIFWRTFAQLAASALLVIQVPEFIDETWVRSTTEALTIGLLVAVIGGLVAVLHAFIASPADSALEKAVRSAAQVLVGTLGGLVLTSFTDVLAVGPILIGGLITAVVAFLVTLFSYQPVPTATTR